MLRKLLRFKIKAWVAIPLLIFTWFWFSTKQTRGITSAQRHVNKITPEWQALQRANPRYRGVRIVAGTAKNGCIVVVGHVLDDQDYEHTLRFIESTDPPRPVDSWLQVTHAEEIFNKMYPLDGKKRVEQASENESE